MSTRGVIARRKGDGFVGTFHRFDSWIEDGLGQNLWNIYHKFYSGFLKEMLVYLIDQHKGGWQFLADARQVTAVEFALKSRVETFDEPPDEEWLITHLNYHPSHHYIYIFDEDTCTMTILASYFPPKQQPPYHRFVATINLHGPEPDWHQLQQLANQWYEEEETGAV